MHLGDVLVDLSWMAENENDASKQIHMFYRQLFFTYYILTNYNNDKWDRWQS